jgi:hypothetical protein
VWLADPYKSYFVGGAYHLLTHLVSREPPSYGDIIWNKFVPLKVSIFALRFLCDTLPTKINLFQRGCLHNDSLLC